MPFTRMVLLKLTFIASIPFSALVEAQAEPAAGADPVAECHRLAASPLDAGRIGPGVSAGKLDADAAVAACRAAVERQRGDGRLQFQLGRALSARKDHMAAQQAYQAGADARFPGAFYNLGVMHRDGIGIPQDYEKAADLFRKAGEAGVAQAIANLGVLYRDGKGVPQDHVEAMRLFRQAAEQGDGSGHRHIGFLHQYGIGVEKDPGEAERLYRLAVEAGDNTARNGLAWIWAVQGKNLDEAEALVKEAIAADPANFRYIDTLGWIYHQQGKQEQAAEQFRRVLELNPDSLVALDHLGDVYAALGRVEEAKAQWRKALDLPEPQPGQTLDWNRAAVEEKLQKGS